MPARLLDEEAGSTEDRMDLNVRYARATPEKALLDWIYLGASPRTKISGPPLDLALDRLNLPRLKRLAKAMDLRAALDGYLSHKESFDRDPDVQANNAVDAVLREREVIP
jgi:hypothetical protein